MFAARHIAAPLLSVVLVVTLVLAGTAGGLGVQRGHDRVAPTAPLNARVTSATPTTVSLAWDASVDDLEVAHYDVYVDSRRTRVKGTRFLAEDLECGQSVAVRVVASDRASNRSPAARLTVFTAACPDSVPPTPPTAFRQPATSQDAVVLEWTASSDDVGVVGYGVYRNQLFVDFTSDPTTTFAGLHCGATFEYEIDAVDAAGNRSRRRSVWVETQPCADLPGPSSQSLSPRARSSAPTDSGSPTVGTADTTAPTPPAKLVVESVSRSSVTLAWRPAFDDVAVTAYRVYRNGTPVQDVELPRAVVAPLACGTASWFGVEALDAAGNRSLRMRVPASTSACTDGPPTVPGPPPPSPVLSPSPQPPISPGDGAPPTQPPSLAVAGVTESSVTLRWSASSDNIAVTGYRVYRNGTPMLDTTETSATVGSLDCGRGYWFGVEALDAAGNRSERTRVPATTSECPTAQPADRRSPSQPPNLAVASVTSATVTLTWGPASDDVGVTGYRVYRNGSRVEDTTGLRSVVGSLSCGTAYWFGVEAFDAAGNFSKRSRVIASTAACPDTQPPTTPTNVTVTSRTATSIALLWTGSTDNVGVTGYGLYKDGGSAGSASTTSAIFSGLTCNRNYTLGVDAYDAAGNRSGKATLLVATTACPDTSPPSAPTGLKVTNVTQTSVTLSWNASTDNVGVEGYDVYRAGTKMAHVTATSAGQSGLACGTSYWFGVEAVDAAGNRSPRTSMNVETSICPPGPPPPSTPPPPPPPSTWSGPITITQGGTYNGSWESTSGTPAVTIATTEPVTINGRVRNLAGGPLIDAVGSGAVQVTVDHVFAYGGDSYQTSGRFFQAYDFKSVTIRNTTIENTRGIELTYGVAGSSVLITRNKHKNIQGNVLSPVGNFVQLRHVRNSTVDISWNEVVNEYNRSHPEDIISIYHSSNAKVHDNMLWHQSTPGNPYSQSSQGGITIDSSDAGPGCDNNEIARNQVIDGFGIVTYVTQGGSNNMLVDNRIVQDGYLDGSTTVRIGNGYSGFAVLPGGTNNHAHGNSVGFINKDGTRLDWDRLDGAPEGQPAEALNNVALPGVITSATEQAEWTLWQQKLSANGITIGA